MSLIKLMGQLERSFMTGHKMDGSASNWKKFKVAYGKRMTNEAGARSLSLMSLHERNGGRGNGMGLGHQNQHHHRKSK